MRNEGYDQQAFRRAQKGVVAGPEQGRLFNLASAEDIVLYKLYWFRIGARIQNVNGTMFGVCSKSKEAPLIWNTCFDGLRPWRSRICLFVP